MIDIVIVTFGTEGGPFRDYSKRLEKFSENCQKLDLKLEVYNPERLLQSKFYKFENRYFKLKRGAGYWHWKPIVLMDAHSLHPDSVLIYIDVDFDLIAIPSNAIKNMIRNNKSLSIFESKEYLRSWSSRRFSRKMTFSKIDHMCIASVLICNFGSRETFNLLQKWRELNDNLDLLLDPVFALNSRHRHDQTIISYLALKERHLFHFMNQGYWANSVEADGFDIEQAWVLSSSINEQNISKRNSFGSSKLRFYIWTVKNRVEIFWFSHGF